MKLYIKNPFIKKQQFKNLYNKTFRLSQYTSFEFELLKDTYYILEFELEIRRKCDHAGIRLYIGLLGLTLALSVYDHRHWDNENNKWIVTNE